MQIVRREFCVCLCAHMHAATVLITGHNDMVNIYQVLLPLFILYSLCYHFKYQGSLPGGSSQTFILEDSEFSVDLPFFIGCSFPLTLITGYALENSLLCSSNPILFLGNQDQSF